MNTDRAFVSATLMADENRSAIESRLSDVLEQSLTPMGVKDCSNTSLKRDSMADLFSSAISVADTNALSVFIAMNTDRAFVSATLMADENRSAIESRLSDVLEQSLTPMGVKDCSNTSLKRDSMADLFSSAISVADTNALSVFIAFPLGSDSQMRRRV